MTKQFLIHAAYKSDAALFLLYSRAMRELKTALLKCSPGNWGTDSQVKFLLDKWAGDFVTAH